MMILVQFLLGISWRGLDMIWQSAIILCDHLDYLSISLTALCDPFLEFVMGIIIAYVSLLLLLLTGTTLTMR